MNSLLVKPVGVIFIDCWEQNWQWENLHPPYHNFYKNMVFELGHYNVQSYVFHTSFLSLQYVTQDVRTYFKEFVSNAFNEADRIQGIADLANATGTEVLSRELVPLTSKPNAVFIPTFEGFKRWSQIHSEISHWIVVGSHWGICTHTKPLGFLNLRDYKRERPHMHFYSLRPSTSTWVETEDQQRATIVSPDKYKNDTQVSWHQHDNNLFELLP